MSEFLDDGDDIVSVSVNVIKKINKQSTIKKKFKVDNVAFKDIFQDDAFDYVKHKSEFISHMNELKTQTVEESVFYKKYIEVQSYRNFSNASLVAKSKIWRPDDFNNKEKTIEQIKNLKPRLRFINQENDSYAVDWLMIRVFCHSMTFDQTPGRFLRFLIYDETSGKYLGATSLSSDVISISDRDLYIGWKLEDRIEGKKRLANSAIGSCIMATQPFGYNFLGGKLVASLLTTKYVRDIWETLYGSKLVGFTTTSLYGTCSMYNGIPYWHKCGSSSGKIALKPDDKYYEVWHNWLKQNRFDEYSGKMTQDEDVSGPVTGAKQRVIQMIFNELGLKIKDYTHGYERGVYYSGVYDNFKEFFQGKIDESGLKIKDKFNKDIDGIIDWWQPKAIQRYINLYDSNRLKEDILFYNDMLNMSYIESKNKYFGEVGR